MIEYHQSDDLYQLKDLIVFWQIELRNTYWEQDFDKYDLKIVDGQQKYK